VSIVLIGLLGLTSFLKSKEQEDINNDFKKRLADVESRLAFTNVRNPLKR
jgi:hypothetical protein